GVHHVDAEDLVQEVFLTLLLQKGGFDPTRSGRAGNPVRFCSWVFTIAYHLLIEHWRRNNKTLSFRALDQPSGTADDSFEAELTAEGSQTEVPVLAGRAELRQALEDCQRKLKQQEQVVVDLWLSTGGQMRLREMAEALKVKSPTTPQRYLQRAFDKLHKCL